MKKSIIAYSVSFLALSANVSYAASGHYRHDRHPVSKAMPSHHRSVPREDIALTCANASLAVYEDRDGVDTSMYFATQGYRIDLLRKLQIS